MATEGRAAGRIPAPVPAQRAKRCRAGRAPTSITRVYPVPPSNATTAIPGCARPVASTVASRIQATASSVAAQANAMVPIRVRVRPRSCTIRARTGNAETAIAVPTNSIACQPATRDGNQPPRTSSSPRAAPATSGATRLAAPVTTEVRTCARSSAVSNESPTRNMYSASPSCPTTYSTDIDGPVGKSADSIRGATDPSSNGPSANPASRSATTCG